MTGWEIPPPKRPTKTDEEFRKEREKNVRWLVKHGYLRSERIKNPMLKVKREDFVPNVGFSSEDMGENPPTLAMLRHLNGGGRIQNPGSKKQKQLS
jgi:hypothetical protein